MNQRNSTAGDAENHKRIRENLHTRSISTAQARIYLILLQLLVLNVLIELILIIIRGRSHQNVFILFDEKRKRPQEVNQTGLLNFDGTAALTIRSAFRAA